MSGETSCPKCGGVLVPAPDHVFTRKTGEPISVCAICDWPVRTQPRDRGDVRFRAHRLLCRGGPLAESYVLVTFRDSDTTVDIPDDPRGRQWRYLIERNAGEPIYLQYVGPL